MFKFTTLFIFIQIFEINIMYEVDITTKQELYKTLETNHVYVFLCISTISQNSSGQIFL